MKYLIIVIIYLGFNISLNAQTRAELEQKRIKTLADISYVDNLLKTTVKEKSENLNAIKTNSYN